ncbi:hypothetical protein IF2G_08446 [Cordyceps javanica]|nr:hypothetical protein IF2G_08446 [Cordyceps javanica]
MQSVADDFVESPWRRADTFICHRFFFPCGDTSEMLSLHVPVTSVLFFLHLVIVGGAIDMKRGASSTMRRSGPCPCRRVEFQLSVLASFENLLIIDSRPRLELFGSWLELEFRRAGKESGRLLRRWRVRAWSCCRSECPSLCVQADDEADDG